MQSTMIRPGEAVATPIWNHAWRLDACFGIPAAGAVLHTLKLRLSPEEQIEATLRRVIPEEMAHG